jgi:hypothetical protein
MARHLPVRPDLARLEREGEALLDAAHATIDDARLALARSYQAPSWERLTLACDLVDAIWRDDVARVRTLVIAHPEVIHESALVRPSDWGPPLTYAANLGRDRIIRLLYDLGARDLLSALGRAALQGQVETARMLYDMVGRPPIADGALGGPAYTLSDEGTALLLALGARVMDDDGRRLAPVDVVLETDSRKPAAKHAILQMYVAHGVELPDTAPIAVHRGRIDLLERHLERDPGLLRRQFTHEEIYPPNWAATTRCSPRTGRRSRARRCCTCAWTTESSRSRAGSSTVACPSMRPPRSTPTASAGTPHSSRRSCRR